VPGGTGDGPPADAATSAAETLATLGYRGEGLVLGLPSAQVYSAEVASDGLPRKDRRQALTYRLEEHLPLDAESLTADFLPPVGGRTFGVAVETAPAGDLIERLARAGIEVEAVCPTALLALWQLVDHLDGAAGFCLMGQAGGVDVFRIRDGRPVSWHTVEADPGEAAQAVQVDLLAQPPEDGAGGQLVAADLGPEFLEAVAGRTGLVCRHVDEASAVALAAQAAPAVLEGRGAGWVNLRRGDLAPGDRLGRLRRPLQAAAALVLVLLAVVTGGAWWRAGRYEAQAAGHIEEQRAVFLRLYPNQRVPGSVRRHLASEATRLAALAGTDQAVPDRPAALDTARRVVSGLPADLRARLVMLRIEPAEVYLEGQARSHADAEAVARGIAAQGLAMEPPRTESLAKGGVAFTLAGRPAAPPAPKTGSSPVAAKGGRP
ncbi:MAG: hypothetical protein IMZ66_01115, partial [Planctomycetes bacterium]|nr:hypothetical protein [Planctomycetota bacterium]